MKKILLMVAGGILSVPFFVSAENVPLTDQFTQNAQTACVDLHYNMSYRSRDARTSGEVSDLQDFLISNGYLSGDPTGYFGTATLAAVKSFQSAVGLGSAGSSGYGGVGPKSRAYIKKMTCAGGRNAQVPTPTTPVATPPTTSLPTPQTTQTVTTTTPVTTPTVAVLGAFTFSSTVFDFNYTQGGTVPPQQSLTFTNRSSAVIPFTISVPNQPAWLNTGYVASQLLAYPGSPIGLGASVNPAGLAPGTYTTTIIISGNFVGSPIRIPVNLTVAGAQASQSSIKITNVQYSPISPRVNDLITTTVTVINDSSVDQTAPFRVNVQGTTATVPALSAHNTVTVTVPNAFSFASPGTQTLNTVIIDSNGNTGNIFTNTLTFVGVTTATTTQAIVPTVEFIGTPTLTLQYDSAGKESMLIGDAVVRIATGNSSVRLSDVPQILQFNYASGAVGTNSMRLTTMLQTVVPSMSLVMTTVLPSNTTATIRVTNTVPTKELFAGSYFMKPAGFLYMDASGAYQSLQFPSFKNAPVSNTVTIIGETSPYITNASSFTNASGYGITTITGVRFNQASNTVDIGGKQLDFQSVNNGTVIQFIPSAYGISAGNYVVQVTHPTTGASNRVNVNILGSSIASAPTVEVIGTPTLSLQYDSAQKESALVANYSVKVTAGVQALSFPSYFLNGGGGSPVSFTFSTAGGQSAGVAYFATGPATIPAGTNATYAIRVTANPNQIFAGSYFATAQPYLSSLDSSGQWMATPLPLATMVGNLRTSTVTVVGERAPYITTVSDDSPNFTNYVIFGVRFHATSNSVTLNGRTIVIPSSANGTSISFNPANFGVTSNGSYPIQVTNPTEGASNVFYVNVTVPIATISIPVITSATTINATQADTQNYMIYWQAVSGATTYKIKIDGLPVQDIGYTTSWGFNVKAGLPTSLSTVGTHLINIQACNATACSGWSNTVTENVTTAIATVAALQVVQGSGFQGGVIAANTASAKIGSFTIINPNSSESVNISAIQINFASPSSPSLLTNVVNLRIVDPSNNTTLAVPVGIPQMSNNFSVNLVIAPSVMKTVDVFADIGSMSSSTIRVSLLPIGTSATSQTNVTPSTVPAGQTVYVAFAPASSQLASVIDAFAQAPASATAPTWAYTWTRNLEVNSPYADDVSALQTALSKEGVYAGEVTGGFYSQTYLGVRAFQAKYGIDATGFVGPTTRAKLNELY